MHKHGTIVRWDAARAFGFIRSPDTPADIFVHLRDFHGTTPPCEGLQVRFEEIHVGGKGPRAVAVRPASQAAAAAAPQAARARTGRAGRARPVGAVADSCRAPLQSAASVPLLSLLLLWLALLAWGVQKGVLPAAWTVGLAAAVNLATALAYAADKNAAQERRWRTPEKHLHLLSLAGGWPAAGWAQQAMRHKSRKRSFQAAYWLTVAAHFAALGAWIAGRVG